MLRPYIIYWVRGNASYEFANGILEIASTQTRTRLRGLKAFENEQEVIERSQTMRVFDVPAIARVYFTTDADYLHLKAYIRMLDYLRLLILEYLQTF